MQHIVREGLGILTPRSPICSADATGRIRTLVESEQRETHNADQQTMHTTHAFHRRVSLLLVVYFARQGLVRPDRRNHIPHSGRTEHICTNEHPPNQEKRGHERHATAVTCSDQTDRLPLAIKDCEKVNEYHVLLCLQHGAQGPTDQVQISWFENPLFSDLTLKLSNGRMLPAHKAILCSQNEYFNILLGSKASKAVSTTSANE